jgi:hypothetical protein
MQCIFFLNRSRWISRYEEQTMTLNMKEVGHSISINQIET